VFQVEHRAALPFYFLSCATFSRSNIVLAALVHSTKVTRNPTDVPFPQKLLRGTLDPEKIKCNARPFKANFL